MTVSADHFSPSLATGQTPKLLPPLPPSAGPSSQGIAIAGPGLQPPSSSGGPPAGSAAGSSGPGPAYEGGALGLVPVSAGGAGALTPTQQSSFPDDLDPHNVPPEFKKEGSDWFAIFNHKVKRVLDVTLVHTLMHERCVFPRAVRGGADWVWG